MPVDFNKIPTHLERFLTMSNKIAFVVDPLE